MRTKQRSGLAPGNGPALSVAQRVASILVDFAENAALVWLVREAEKGWVKYGLDGLISAK